jgi:RNA polymerase sigma factor (TIGR02999 family)
MAIPPSGPVTELLHRWRDGDPGADDQLLRLVYQELRRRAAACLRRERNNHTLNPTALVHEAYLRLVGQSAAYGNRSQFFALAATMMRRVLVDHARARARAKRPPPQLQVGLDSLPIPAAAPSRPDLLAIDRALTELATFDPRQARIVELRFFGGLTVDETANAIGMSAATVKREWNVARAWLHESISGQEL